MGLGKNKKTTVTSSTKKTVALEPIHKPTNNSSVKVDLVHLANYQDGLATYAYRQCLDKLGNIQGMYSCENMLKTFTVENGQRFVGTMSPKNKNGSRDFGICQLNSANPIHREFINSEDFKDPYKQIDYCLGVWIDAKRKGSMPWYGNSKYDYMYSIKQIERRKRIRTQVNII